MALSINEDELTNILAEVDRELDGALAGARDRLHKADDEKSSSASPASASPEGSSDGSDSAGGPPMADASASDGSAPPPGADASAPPMDGSAPAAPPMDGSAPPADGSAAAPGEDLESKLSALPEDQLRHLYMAAKQALFARMQSAAPAASPAAPPAAPPMASPSPSPAAPPPPAMKGEMKASPANGGGKTSAIKVGKSETREDNLMKAEDQKKMETLQAEVAELKKMNEGLFKAVGMLGAPLRKAVTSVAHLPKPGEGADKAEVKLTKAEITSKLSDVCRDPKTTPKDRSLVNGYYDGRHGVDKIAHLLS